VDMEGGPGVDHVANINAVQSDERFALVLCCECLEHDITPMETAATCRRFLAPGGILVITTPANGFPEHRFPVDLWRFMPDAYAMLFEGLTTLEVVQIEGPTMCGVACNPAGS
jgi:2-polyprenyl-3-methyl-5-hydroxy-6-metoxy-1,4-benzoquinol methylase